VTAAIGPLTKQNQPSLLGPRERGLLGRRAPVVPQHFRLVVVDPRGCWQRGARCDEPER